MSFPRVGVRSSGTPHGHVETVRQSGTKIAYRMR